MHDICSRLLDGVVLVPDSAIRDAQVHLWENYRLVTEPGGATAYASLLGGFFSPPPGSHIGVLMCGSNADSRSLEIMNG